MDEPVFDVATGPKLVVSQGDTHRNGAHRATSPTVLGCQVDTRRDSKHAAFDIVLLLEKAGVDLGQLHRDVDRRPESRGWNHDVP